MVIFFAAMLVFLGLLVLQCDSTLSDGSVYHPTVEAIVILVTALALVVVC